MPHRSANHPWIRPFLLCCLLPFLLGFHFSADCHGRPQTGTVTPSVLLASPADASLHLATICRKSGETLAHFFPATIPWYVSNVAIAGYVVALGLLIWLLVHLRTRSLRNEQRQLAILAGRRARKLAKARKAVQEAYTERDQLLSNASRELFDPLHSISEYASHLLRDSSITGERRQQIKAIHENSERLLQVIDKFFGASADNPANGDTRAARAYEGPPKRLLVVGELEINRRLLREVLTPIGFEVDEANSCQTALGSIQTKTYDLIAIDARIGGADTIDILPTLRRKTGGAIPILGLSASQADMGSGEARHIGFDDLLLKPFQESELLDKLGRLMQLQWTRSPKGASRQKPNPSRGGKASRY